MFNYPSKEHYTVRGIDVSHHQGNINWSGVRSDGVIFAYIKATEGGDFVDSEFARNWTGSKEAGLYRGAYHFYTFCKSGKEQARNFIHTVPVELHTLPPVIDLEYSGNCKKRPPKKEFLEELSDFCREVEKAFKVKPIFYINYDSYNDYLKGEIDDHGFWVRDIFFQPRFETWLFWQYASRGRIRGIIGPVDLNVFSGTLEEFLHLLNVRTTRQSNELDESRAAAYCLKSS